MLWPGTISQVTAGNILYQWQKARTHTEESALYIFEERQVAKILRIVFYNSILYMWYPNTLNENPPYFTVYKHHLSFHSLLAMNGWTKQEETIPTVGVLQRQRKHLATHVSQNFFSNGHKGVTWPDYVLENALVASIEMAWDTQRKPVHPATILTQGSMRMALSTIPNRCDREKREGGQRGKMGRREKKG